MSFQLVLPGSLPRSGTFWHAVGPDGRQLPPLPCPPAEVEVPIYSIGNGQFLVDDRESDIPLVLPRGIPANLGMSSIAGPPVPGGGGGEPLPPPPPDNRRNSEKFASLGAWQIDPSDAQVNAPDLYTACQDFPSSPSGPNLQIKKYGADAVLIKANHFDYSAETDRDFALLVCDKVERPTWKTVDLQGASDSQDGWLIEALVPQSAVVDSMYFMVTNLTTTAAAFFRAVPYGGPEVSLSGPAEFSPVNNTITLHAAISDLSGTTGQQLMLTVDGLDPRYSVSSGNTISIDTRYTPNGVGTIYAKVVNYNARVVDPNNTPMDAKLQFDGTANLPLDFENPTYLAYPGDSASPDIGTIYSLWAISSAKYIRGKIYEPGSNRTLKSFSGYSPSAVLVEFDWDFTDSDGVTPYGGDNYGVSFEAADTSNFANATSLAVINKIEKAGVRVAKWAISQYEEVKPSSYSGNGSWINSEMSRWGNAIGFMYETLMAGKFGSQSQYFAWQVGDNRDTPVNPHMPFALNSTSEAGWRNWVNTVVINRNYSDFNYGPGHGNGYLMGGGEYRFSWMNYVNTKIEASEMQSWVQTGASADKRYKMRKVAMWACYTGRLAPYGNWANAFGIGNTAKQLNSFMGKNAGLFFNDDLKFMPYGSPATDVAEVAATFEKYWVMGANPYPGGASPNYSIQFAFGVTAGVFPEILKAKPVIIGFYYLPFAGVYDNELMVNDISKVVQ